LPPWAAGIAAALFADGVGAALARLAPQTVPLWPDLGLLSLASPSLGALLTGAHTIVTIAVALFLLMILERITDHWHRRRWLLAVVLVAVLVATGLTAADPVATIARGVAGGLVLVAIVLGVLRYDSAALPAFVATGAVLSVIDEAVRGGWPAAPLHAFIAAGATAAVAWLATQYLVAARSAATTAATARQPRSPSTA
jgi:hypothetical protein